MTKFDSIKWKQHYAVQFRRQKLSRRCIAIRASLQKRGGPPPILRRISCIRSRSGIREHFIIRVTVASEQTRADNATLRENAVPWTSERVSEAGDTRQTRIEVAAAVLPFSESFCFISFFEYPVLLLLYKTADSLLFESTKSEQKLILTLIRVVSLAHKHTRCFERGTNVRLIWFRSGLEVVYFKC